MLELDATLPSIYERGPCETPPWTISKPKINLECTVYKKDDTPPDMYKNKLKSILENIGECSVLYTDGSMTENGTGSAFSTLDNSYSWTLQRQTSIFTAELYAIWQALLYADMKLQGIIVIGSDSLSSLQAISNAYSLDPLVQRIY